VCLQLGQQAREPRPERRQFGQRNAAFGQGENGLLGNETVPAHVGVDRITHQPEAGVGIEGFGGLKRGKRVGHWNAQLAPDFARDRGEGRDLVGGAIHVSGASRRRGHEHYFGARGPHPIYDLAQVRPEVGGEDARDIVHAEHHQHQIWTMAKDVGINAAEGVAGRVAADSSVKHLERGRWIESA